MIDLLEIKRRFKSIYNKDSRVFRAPGRVNLIGEHTDYNDGFVMPVAIDFFTWVAAAPRDDRKIRVHSENLSSDAEIDLNNRSPQPSKSWIDYVQGVVITLEQASFRLSGADLMISSEVPIGAGLSSSAAIEVAVATALLATSQFTVDRIELAKLCQRAENEFVGTRCGIMDQFTSCNGWSGHALLLDCRSLDFQLLPLPDGISLVICNSMVKHELSGGEYNLRREQCETGVALLSKSFPHILALRDVTFEQLEQCKRELPEIVYKRCRHVVTENMRVLEAASALKNADLSAFGTLMRASHCSLRDDYEVSCTELDTLVDLAIQVEGVYGSRMTGGGFGGCTISIVKTDQVSEFKDFIVAGYERAFGRKPEIYTSTAAMGADEVTGS